jgi:hypothetical protein
MITLPTKYIRLAGDLAEPDDSLTLPVEVGGYDDRTGQYHRWAKYQVRYNFRTGQYEAEGAVEVGGCNTDTLYLTAASLPALYGALADIQIAF